MSTKRAIKRMFLTLMWLGMATGMGIIITAAMRAQESGACKGYEITINGSKKDMLFTTKEQVVKLLKLATKGEIKGQRRSEFDLQVIEDLLEQSSWVYNADLYFDNNDILHANVTERKPLARIFNTLGESFYIDEAGKHIPLSEKISLDLPVFTGYPVKRYMNAADSNLMQNMIATASFISSDPFWNAQVSQIDINHCGTDCWSMEMIPVVGNHKVELGDGSDIASKFHRLYLFYDQVLKRTGFDKYQKIDVQYNGQVVGIKDNYTKVDSLQLRKNIETLLQQSRQTNEMMEVTPALANPERLQADTSAAAKLMYSGTEEASDSLLNQLSDEPLVVKKETPLAPHPVAEKPEAKKENNVKPTIRKTEPKNEIRESDTKKVTVKKAEMKKTGTKEPVKKAAVKPGTPKTTQSLKANNKTTSAKTVSNKPVTSKASASKKEVSAPIKRASTDKSKPKATSNKTVSDKATTGKTSASKKEVSASIKKPSTVKSKSKPAATKKPVVKKETKQVD